MLNAIIRLALKHRLLVATAALLLLLYGGGQILNLPIDVFPDLDRPRVTVMVEAPGLAPEEVETLITFPIESVLNGATGVQTVRTQSGVGIAVIHAEFDWGSDIFTDCQIVNQRLALVADQMPPGVTPQIAPISSVMGQIMIIGIWSDNDKTSPMELRTLADWVIRQRLRTIPGVSQVFVIGGERKQFQVLLSPDELLRYGTTVKEVKTAIAESNDNATGGYLDEQGPNELLVRSLGRIQTIEQLQNVVVTMRDGRPVLLDQVARVVEGPQVKRGDSAAFARRPDGTFSGGPAVVLTVNKQPHADTRQVSNQIMAALAELRPSLPGDIRIHPELYQQKAFIDLAIENVAEALRDGGILVVIVLFVFLLNFRTTFITLTAIPLSLVVTGLVFKWFDLSINTMTLGGLAVAIGELVDDAIVDVENIYRRLKENQSLARPRSALLVVYEASKEIRNSIVFGTLIVVLVFIPVFALGGMEGRLFTPLGIAYIVSILSSLLVSLTLTPVLSYWLLAERRIWPWFAVVLSPIVTLAMVHWMLPELLRLVRLGGAATWVADASLWTQAAMALALAPLFWWLMIFAERGSQQRDDGLLLRVLKRAAASGIRLGLSFPTAVLVVAFGLVVVSVFGLFGLERDFLPPFDEGVMQLNIVLPPGTSLKTSSEVAREVEKRFMEIDDVAAFVRRTGRAELDEHTVTVNFTEVIASFDPNSPRRRSDIIQDLRNRMGEIPGILVAVDQPMQHLISHTLSGVQAQVAIKVFGDDLTTLRRAAKQIKAAIADVKGVKDLQVEPQIDIPQLRIEINGEQLKKYGLRRASINELVTTAMNGEVVSEVVVGQRQFDLLVRLDEPYREDLDAVRRLTIPLPEGGATTLGSVAKVYRDFGPNMIQREQVRRRIVIQCNTAGRGLVDVVRDIKARIDPIEQSLPSGYFVEYGGQFESQQSASQTILLLSSVSIIGMFLVLYTMFGSANLSLQVMIALPTALIGSVAALYLTGQTLTVAAMVGFISLCGIASRNGILLINHYLYLVQHDGESWSMQMIVRAGRERVAPVLMTALTSGIGLVPLALAAGEPGKEILYPVATVIIGGLATSTFLEFLVRPALFWKFGIGAARHLVAQDQDRCLLGETPHEPTSTIG